MKAPEAQKFPTKAKPTTDKPKDKPAKAVSNQNKQAASVRRTFTLTTDEDQKITAVAMKLSQERGKQVSASEALRVIIQAYGGKAWEG